MNIIGIGGDCEHNSSVCLIKNNKLVYAESEERITRQKNDGSFPINVLREALNQLDDNEDVAIAVSGKQYLSESLINNAANIAQLAKVIREQSWFDIHLYSCRLLDGYEIQRFEHHQCHARCAAAFSVFREALILVADGQGDDVTISAWNYNSGIIQNIWKNYTNQGSLGFLYAAVTEFLGYKRLQDEGKVTAIASSGAINGRLLKELKLLTKIQLDDANLPELNFSDTLLKDYELDNPLFNSKLAELLNGYKREDIAATIQALSEELIIEIINILKGRLEFRNLILSGGLFANVSLNHKIARTIDLSGLDICPPMGDEGTSIGAAAELLHSRTGIDLKIENVYLGYNLDLDNPDLAEYFPGYTFTYCNDDWKISKGIEYLIRYEPICLAIGKGEFGPRALGNRSILYRPDYKNTQLWLNKKLGRDRVMPFAPCIRDCNLNDSTVPFEVSSASYEYMTISHQVKEEFIQKCPGVVHVDKTARFQVVKRETHKLLWLLLKEFEVKTGLPALLNTSLNRHGYPISRSLDNILECASISEIPFIITANGYYESRKSN